LRRPDDWPAAADTLARVEVTRWVDDHRYSLGLDLACPWGGFAGGDPARPAWQAVVRGRSMGDGAVAARWSPSTGPPSPSLAAADEMQWGDWTPRIGLAASAPDAGWSIAVTATSFFEA